MIQADKELIQSQLKLSSLKVRQKEVAFYGANFESIATVSALVAGFTIGALQNRLPNDAHYALSLLFHCAFPLTVMHSLFCVCNSTFVSMFGPGLALRGRDGSMHRAVEGMMQERTDVFSYFQSAILGAHIGTAILIWCFRAHFSYGWLDGTSFFFFFFFKAITVKASHQVCANQHI